MKRFQHIICIIILISCTLLQLSCRKYLEARPNKSLAVPSTLQDMRAILDYDFNLNHQNPSSLEIAADNYYLTYNDWAGLSNVAERENHIWQADAEYETNWTSPYKVVFYANTVLDNIGKITETNQNMVLRNTIKGEALFWRSWAFFHLAQLYCQPFDPAGNNNSEGIVLRLHSNIDEKSTRSSVQETYDRIIGDLKVAASLLPTTIQYKTRPTKAAAYAALARANLAMEAYTDAGKYADSCLQLSNQLIDYNTVNANAAIPFSVFNAEVILHAYSSGGSSLNPNACKVDSLLYRSYDANDLRKTIFFKNNGNGSYGFKGGYHGITANSFFNGLATDEVLLISAESQARQGNISRAMADLNALLVKRWKTGTFIPLVASTADEALQYVLQERRKELLFRGVRWSDLRRLNRDPRFAVTPKRVLNNETYVLPPGDLRYVLLIPSSVVILTGMQQNPR